MTPRIGTRFGTRRISIGPHRGRSTTTAEFPAPTRFGRPGTPTDQAWIETLFGHVKTEWPHLEKITDSNTLRAELDNARHDYNTRRLHASLGYVTPTTNTKAEATPSARPAKTASNGPASPASPTIATTTKTSHEHTRPMRRNQTPKNGHLLRSTSQSVVSFRTPLSHQRPTADPRKPANTRVRAPLTTNPHSVRVQILAQPDALTIGLPRYRAIAVVESRTHSPLKSEAPIFRALLPDPQLHVRLTQRGLQLFVLRLEIRLPRRPAPLGPRGAKQR